MSLSQKHAGLLLVPWFNKGEWNYVYHCIYSPKENQHQKAVDILKIWKLRTPILSTGIEGTLIILDVLTGTNSLNSEQSRYIYSVAVMRFLNLSAANSERQGDFTRTSAKNDLPDWLISLRHDIAHGHNMPSLAMLKKGLQFGLKWLREKYWQLESQDIKDLFITEETLPNGALSNALSIYIYIKLNMFQKNDLNAIWLQQAKEMIFKKFKKRLASVKMMTDILEEMIRQSLALSQNKMGDEKIISDLLVSKDVLLHSLALDNADFLRLNEDFRLLWNSLLNILHEHKLILKLIEHLYRVICDLKFSHTLKTISALWIRAIFEALEELKNGQDMETRNTTETPKVTEENDKINKTHVLKFEFREFYKEEAELFQKLALTTPNMWSQMILPGILSYNGNSKPFEEETLRIINEKLSRAEDIRNLEDHIFTLEDLHINEHPNEGTNVTDLISSAVDFAKNEGCVSEMVIAGPRWAKIEDTSSFKRCPLGILPHQIGRKHPFLAINSY